MESRTPADTGTWPSGLSPPYLHSLRWQRAGPSFLSGAGPACSAGPLSFSAALPLWTVTAWHLLLPGSCRICTVQHLSKEHKGSSTRGVGLRRLWLGSTWGTTELLPASPNRLAGLEQGLKSSNTLICLFTNGDRILRSPPSMFLPKGHRLSNNCQ